MVEMVFSRIKVAFLVALFLSPVCVDAWGKSFDAWFAQKHTLDALQIATPSLKIEPLAAM